MKRTYMPDVIIRCAINWLIWIIIIGILAILTICSACTNARPVYINEPMRAYRMERMGTTGWWLSDSLVESLALKLDDIN